MSEPGHPQSTGPAAILEDRLAVFPVFERLDGDCLAALCRAGRVERVPPGKTLLRQGETSPTLWILLSGRAKMLRHSPLGHTALLALFGPGEIVGAVAALHGGPADASVETLEAVELLAIPAGGLIALLQDNPQWMGPVLATLSERLVECKNCLVESVASRVEVRLAHLFLKLADQIGSPSDDGIRVPVHLSRQDLADMTGTRLETAIRIMSRWGKEGTVLTHADGFVVGDREALKTLVVG